MIECISIVILIGLFLLVHRSIPSRTNQHISISPSEPLTPKQIKKQIEFLKTHKRVGYMFGKRVKKKDYPEAMKSVYFVWRWIEK